jgi:WD40 repeat protein
VGFVRAVAWSPDGKTIATGSNDGELKLWEVATKKERAALKGHKGNVIALAFSANSRTLASASSVIRIWDATSAKELNATKNQLEQITALAFNNDGTVLASGGKKVRLWIMPTTAGKK